MKIYVFLSLFLFIPQFASAGLCKQWSQPEEIGSLPVDIIDEASGLIATPDHLAHINDSGSDAQLHWTRHNGELVVTHDLADEEYFDTEALAKFSENGSHYLIVADVGDNAEKRGLIRKSIFTVFGKMFGKPPTALYIFKLTDWTPQSAPQFIQKIELAYPDRPHNAESVAVHPKTGDIYLLTKESRFEKHGHIPSTLFRIAKGQWLSENTTPRPSSKKLTWQKVREVPLHEINRDRGDVGKLSTGMDISADGESFVVLTYDNAIEFTAKSLLSHGDLLRGRDYNIIPTQDLSQEEAIH